MRLVNANKLLNMDHEEAMNYIKHGCDYDPDKIVEELEELPVHVTTVTSDKHPFSASEIEMISRKKAMEAVKRGGKK